MKDYYKILEVEKSASLDEIKKSYKRLARTWHPDVFPNDPEKQKEASEKFKDINAAWETLSDTRKRQDYDLGMSGRGRPRPGRGFDFGGFGGFGGFDLRRNTGERGTHVVTEVSLTLNEILTGCVKDVEFERSIQCTECNGYGGDQKTCTACDGSGYEQIIDGQMRIMHPCGMCDGRGTSVDKKCDQCNGTCFTGKSLEKVKITIPPGIHEGIAMTFKAAGSPGSFGGQAGDLIIHIVEEEHESITRSGHDLYLEIPINYTQLVYGCNIDVNDLENSLSLKIPAGTQTNAKFKMKGKGMPIMHTDRRGDFYVTLKLNIPTNLSQELNEILEKLAQLEKD